MKKSTHKPITLTNSLIWNKEGYHLYKEAIYNNDIAALKDLFLNRPILILPTTTLATFFRDADLSIIMKLFSDNEFTSNFPTKLLKFYFNHPDYEITLILRSLKNLLPSHTRLYIERGVFSIQLQNPKETKDDFFSGSHTRESFARRSLALGC
jgi:hypothetical protein